MGVRAQGGDGGKGSGRRQELSDLADLTKAQKNLTWPAAKDRCDVAWHPNVTHSLPVTMATCKHMLAGVMSPGFLMLPRNTSKDYLRC